MGATGRVSRKLVSQQSEKKKAAHEQLVGGFKHVLVFHNIWDVILPTWTFIFFRGVGIPPTSTNQLKILRSSKQLGASRLPHPFRPAAGGSGGELGIRKKIIAQDWFGCGLILIYHC